MKKFRLIIVGAASLIIIAQLFLTDYSDLSWSENAGAYLVILSMLCVIFSMILSNRHEQKNQ